MPERQAEAHFGLGELARHRGDLGAASRLFQTALNECGVDSFWAAQPRSHVLVALGRVAEAEGDANKAMSLHRRALEVALRHSMLPSAAGAAEGMAGVALLDCDGERAATLLGAGVALRGMSIAHDPDVARVSAGARALIGDAAYAGAFSRAAALSRSAALALLG